MSNDLEEGIVSRVPADQYHSLPGLSITRLKTIARSPQHYLYELSHPRSTSAMTLGTAAHCAVLEPHLYDSRFVIWDMRTESGRMSPRSGKQWEAFSTHAKDHGKTVLIADEHALAQDIGRAVRSDPIAMKYLSFGEPEVTMQWMLHDRQCRGRADWITKIDGEPVIVGLKTARDCRHFAFGAQAAKLSYHMQWAFYWSGYLAITGNKAKMIEIVVESTAPHAVVVYQISDDILLQGEEEYMRLIDRLEECEAKDQWPGPETEEQVLTLPSWVYSQQDDLAEIGLET